MKLTNIFPQIKTSTKVQAKRSEATTAKVEAANVAAGSDQVNLSASSQDVQKAQEILRQTPSVRADKVRALKDLIDRGEYEVDPRQVADKMMISLISDNVTGE